MHRPDITWWFVTGGTIRAKLVAFNTAFSEILVQKFFSPSFSS
jgi:hypothetical protein